MLWERGFRKLETEAMTPVSVGAVAHCPVLAALSSSVGCCLSPGGPGRKYSSPQGLLLVVGAETLELQVSLLWA